MAQPKTSTFGHRSKLGHRLFRVLLAGAGKSDRIQTLYAPPIEDHPRGDHARCIRSICHLRHESETHLEFFMGRDLLDWSGVFYFQRSAKQFMTWTHSLAKTLTALILASAMQPLVAEPSGIAAQFLIKNPELTAKELKHKILDLCTNS
jgi:hypothetical protein